MGYVTLDRSAVLGHDDEDVEIVGEREQLYDDFYAGFYDRDAAPSVAFGQDFRGWNSSYTGDPIPLNEMVEWRAATVARIAELDPQRILEIGVGSGLVLSQLVSTCEQYWGTDVSSVAVSNLTHRLDAMAVPWRGRVRLSTQPAHIIDGLPEQYFDTIVINSVVQYFPNVGYLDDILDKMIGLLRPGGSVFIGDVRNHALQGPFETGVALAQLHDGDDTTEVCDRIRRAVVGEPELLLAPDFFTTWADRTDTVAGIDIQVKRGQAHNELTWYRYDVVIHKTPAPVRSLAEVHAQWTWPHCGGTTGLAQRLTAGDRPISVRVTGIPRSGLIGEVNAHHALRNGTSPTEARTIATHHHTDAVTPEHLHRIGRANGYHVAVTWAQHPGEIDAVFTSITDPIPRWTHVYQPTTTPMTPSPAVHANDPQANSRLAEIRKHLTQHLPDYMVPSQIVVLDAMPLTVSGKI
ncbi:methyltransferase, partial [Nocardia sp. R7R-8]|uniref:methyltransferase n=1 Tax=Nocardia sp. R7R-8 TaxID=3459304 RepID=UPI00403D6AB1